MIEVKNLTKQYGKHKAVNGLSFTVNKGEIVGFLGPNGAGKSSTMNMITGYMSATEGTVLIDGIDVLENPLEAKKRIGYLPEIPPLYMDMTVKEYLTFVAELKKVKQGALKAHLREICELVQISHVTDRLIKNLSKGYKQRVGVAQALIGNPEVLILDEPTVGLDPKQIIEIRHLVKDLSKNHTIILSSHILSEVSAICDRVMIMNKGQLVVSDTPEHLSHALTGSSKMMVRVREWEETFLEALASTSEIQTVTVDRQREEGTMDLIVEGEPGKDMRETLYKRCYELGHPLLLMKPIDLSLEDIFLQVTDQELPSQEIEGVADIEETAAHQA